MALTGVINVYVRPYIPQIVEAIKRCGITEAYLFGSASTDCFQFWRSDIDIGVRGSEEQVLQLMSELHKLEIPYDRDVINLSKEGNTRLDEEILKGVKLV